VARPIHLAVLDVALAQTDDRAGWRVALRDIVRALPHLNPATVRTHVASRCCVNAPSNHQSRYPYFRAVGRGVYRVEPAFRRMTRRHSRTGWQDRILERLDSGVDPTLIDESLRLTPTERLERMRKAAESLDAMKSR
jgi:hypothetical protein